MAIELAPAQAVPGLVYFIGAGPGDPELFTLKGQRLLYQADLVLYAGSLVNPDVLRAARLDARLVDTAALPLDEQVALMRAAARSGQRIVRLHTGDPSIYGSISEQICALEQDGIPYMIVPGVSSAFAAAAALGIEFTLPQLTQSVIFTRLGGRTPMPSGEALRDLAAHHTSLVIFLSAGMIAGVVDELLAAGYPPHTPLAVVYRASWPDQLVLHGALEDITARLQAAEVTHQALIVVSPALDSAARRSAPNSHLYGAALQAPARQDSLAILALTRGGLRTGRRLHDLLPGATLYAPARLLAAAGPSTAASPAPGVVAYATSVRQALQSAFLSHHALVCVMSTGIVVRDLAPLLRSKLTDPAVVVVDEAGQFAISLLSGHVGGANELAHRVAALLGATPVLTTSSDVQGLPALDLLGRQRGWLLESPAALTSVSAALVNAGSLAVLQDAGDESWQAGLPGELIRCASWDELQAAAPWPAIAVTCRELPPQVAVALPDLLVYHPPCLAVGVGCNRGASAAEILAAVRATLAHAGLSLAGLACLASVEDKAAEPGLLQAAQELGRPLKIFSRAEILALGQPPNPSAQVQAALGLPGVAEPCALLASAGGRLLVEKTKSGNVTVAVAQARQELL